MENAGKLPNGVQRKTAKGRTYFYYTAQMEDGRVRRWRLPSPAAAQFPHEYATAVAEACGLEGPIWQRPAKPVLVYFIGGVQGPIKIGMAINPAVRLRELQTAHHVRLIVHATCPGGQRKEREYHKRFSAHRLHGEWFARTPEIEAEIARLQGEG